MQSLWRTFMAFLVWLSADPNQITEETPRAAAAVAVAYAALTPEPEPEPKPVKPVGPVSEPQKPAARKPAQQPCPTGTCPLR